MSEAEPRQSLSMSFLGLAGIGVAIGLMHLPLSLQLSLTLTYQSSIVRTPQVCGSKSRSCLVRRWGEGQGRAAMVTGV